jgi:hypothetical protein
MVLQVIVPLLVPVVTGLIGALGLMLKDRRLARDSRHLREQALAEATAEVGFATEWWQAQQLLGGDALSVANPKMVAWLAEAEATVAVAKRHTTPRHNPVTLRRLLLIEPMHRRSSRVVRVLFWISVIWLCVGAIATAGDIGRNSQHSWIGSDIALLVVSALIVLLLHIWAEASDQSSPVPTPHATLEGHATSAAHGATTGTITAS